MTLPVDHIHDCTGPDRTCPCGYVFRVPPVCFSLDVYDARRPVGEQSVVSEGFNCEDVSVVVEALREAIRTLEAA